MAVLFYCNKPTNQEQNLRKLYARPIDQWPSPIVDKGVSVIELGALPKPDNIENKELVHLGRVLFFDPRLSKSNTIACASCHSPETNWTDLQEKSFGHKRNAGLRNAMSLENIWAQPGPFFWDGRAKTLEEQALFPIQDHLEMAQDTTELIKEISEVSGYRPLFINAYGKDSITMKSISHALATFQRTITSKQTRLDQFIKGNHEVLTDQEVEGLHVFRTKAKCMNCHHGPFFTDFDFHNEGQHHLGKRFEDLGLYTVTKNEKDIGKFKTPSLRNVMNTKPWMHNGMFDNMRGILLLYNQGMLDPEVTSSPNTMHKLPPTDTLLHPLHLSHSEIEALEAFLHTLSSSPNRVRPPTIPEK